MTSQQKADLALRQWQSLRELPPDQRISELMADFFLSDEDARFEHVMRCVTREMEDAHAVR